MTPRSLLLTAVALSVLFWLALDVDNPIAVAQPHTPGDGPVAHASQAQQQEQPVLTITHSEVITVGIRALFTATVMIDMEPVDQDAYSFSWTFGDSGTGQGRTTSYIFQDHGVFPVTVIATSNAHRLVTTVRVPVRPNIVIVEEKPIEGLKCDNTGPVEANNPVSLVASVAQGEPASYSWSLGYPGSPRLDGAVVTHRYERPELSPYAVTVTARNGKTPNGVTCTTIVTVLDETIGGLDFTWKGAPNPRKPLQFEATTKRGTRVAYQWFWGDGSTGIGNRTEYPFKELGTFEVTLEASNSRNSLRLSRTLIIVPPAPRSIRGSNDGPKAVNIDLLANVSVETDEPITSYSWLWGDGTSAERTSVSFATHRYTRQGVYGIQTTARNEGGGVTGSQIAYIGVSHPVVGLAIPNQYAGANMAPANRPITLTVIFSPTLPDGKYEHYLYDWNWGDGTVIQTPRTSLAHTYLSGGNFVVQVTATRTVTANTPANLYGATVVLVNPNVYLPVMAQSASFLAASPLIVPDVPTPTHTPTPEPTEPDEQDQTGEPTVPPGQTPSPSPAPTDEMPSPLPSAVAETPPPTATVYNPTPIPPTATEAPTPTSTPIPTPTQVEGGTIPPVPG